MLKISSCHSLLNQQNLQDLSTLDCMLSFDRGIQKYIPDNLKMVDTCHVKILVYIIHSVLLLLLNDLVSALEAPSVLTLRSHGTMSSC